MSFLDIAQPLAAKGIPQTPIRPGTKRAFLLDFPTTATTDVTKLTEWNATYSDCGSASVARAEEGGIFIFETDSPDVIARIKADTGQDLMSIPTFRVRSREGRGHSYFKHTAWTISNLPNISQTYVIGQDWSLRANREYCVSAGSLHPETGKPYTALNDNPIAEAPEWLIKWMLSQKIQQSYNGTGKKDNTPRNANGKVPHGSLHGFMLSQAGRLRRAGCNQEEIETALLRIVHEQCEPPIDDAKVIQMSKSICNFPQGNDAQQQFAQQDAPEEKPLFTLPVSTIMASKVLGELYQQVFAPNDWPVELALPALVTAASALVPERKTGQIMLQDNFTHLYTALIGDMHVGKSQVIDWAVKSLGIYADLRGEHYISSKFGSAEQMWKFMSSHKSTFKGAVLVNPDEWSHVMAKAGIPDSSFASTLTTAFYKRRHSVTLGGARGGFELEIPFPFSIVGGVVQNDFYSVFGSTTIGGLYDRFLFGLAPEGFNWSYRPFPADHPLFHDWLTEEPHGYLKTSPVAPSIEPGVFELAKEWGKKDPSLGRITEVCIRVATVFASIDGRDVVKAEDLEKLWPLAEYQKAIRAVFQPNAGQNPDAIYANVALLWIQQNAKQWRTVRELQQGTNYQRRQLGPNVCFRALHGLHKDGEVDMWVSQLVDDPQTGHKKLNELPPGFTGKRPRLGGGLVRVALRD